MNLVRTVSAPATESLAPALQDYFSGHYAACLEQCRLHADEGHPERPAALNLMARTYLRLQQPAQAVSTLVAEVAEFAEAESRLEADMLLAFAHGMMHDFASAGAYLESLHGPEADAAPAALRAEFAHTEALVAWMRGDMEAAEAVLAREAFDLSPTSRGRDAITVSWIAARRGQYEEHARLLMQGTELLQAANPVDIGMLAAATRALCSLSREIALPNLLRRAQQLYAAVPWTDELAVDQFASARTLGWALALQGQSRYFESLRLMHKASSLAPSRAWRVFALVDRAALKRYVGELASSSADLYEALEMSKTVDWSDSPDEARIALVAAAELFATIDVREASTLLVQYTQIEDALSARLAMLRDKRTEAYRSFATGVIQQTLGDGRKARSFFELAFHNWEEAGFAWRSALAALHIFQVTGEAQWFETARQKIREYPDSWVAAQINAAASGVGDDAWNRMTPRQREVFRALCEGLTARKIADRLECSPNTVRNHIHWVYQAFRVNSQPELIAEARKRQLL
jgi:DNA-binding CsgD family transcriptional regulator/tetratricopeptide (TPR) repeat protein